MFDCVYRPLVFSLMNNSVTATIVSSENVKSAKKILNVNEGKKYQFGC
jgi:hypothetical protein